MYDPAPEVCEMAVHFLEEACESKEILQLVVDMQPTMDHLGEIGHPLLLKYVHKTRKQLHIPDFCQVHVYTTGLSLSLRCWVH